MYPTPLYSHVGRPPFADVYDPAEDTFILIDALENDAEDLKHRVGICLEVGTGSGLVSTFLATVLGSKAYYLCTDFNPVATVCAAETAQRNNVHIQPVITDLVKGLLPRLHGIVDLLVFNPPYVVTPSEENHHTSGIDAPGADSDQRTPIFIATLPSDCHLYVGTPGLAAAWAGGNRGREVMDRFFPFVSDLLSDMGVFYLVVLQDNNPDDILELMMKYGLRGSVALSRQAGRERLSVLKFCRC